MNKISIIPIAAIVLLSCEKRTITCFEFTPQNPVAANAIIFDAGCTQNAVSFRWNFGDGSSDTTTTERTITHIYNAPGAYAVSLKAERHSGMSIKKSKVKDTQTIIVK